MTEMVVREAEKLGGRRRARTAYDFPVEVSWILGIEVGQGWRS